MAEGIRRFAAGDKWDVGGIHVRAINGRKAPGDLRLELETRSGWIPIPMSLVALFTEFFYENEDVLYPPPRFLGGRKFVRFLENAIATGWIAASAELETEKRDKRIRETGSGKQLTEEEMLERDYEASLRRLGPP